MTRFLVLAAIISLLSGVFTSNTAYADAWCPTIWDCEKALNATQQRLDDAEKENARLRRANRSLAQSNTTRIEERNKALESVRSLRESFARVLKRAETAEAKVVLLKEQTTRQIAALLDREKQIVHVRNDGTAWTALMSCLSILIIFLWKGVQRHPPKLISLPSPARWVFILGGQKMTMKEVSDYIAALQAKVREAQNGYSALYLRYEDALEKLKRQCVLNAALLHTQRRQTAKSDPSLRIRNSLGLNIHDAATSPWLALELMRMTDQPRARDLSKVSPNEEADLLAGFKEIFAVPDADRKNSVPVPVQPPDRQVACV